MVESCQQIKSNFRFVERIGSGGNSHVWRGENRHTGARVAIKVQKKEIMSKEDIADF